MQHSKIALILLATFTVVGSSRASHSKVKEVLETAEGQVMVKCKANGEDVGMSITWGVPKSRCIVQCTGVRSNGTNGDDFTYEHEFIKAFSVTLGTTKCECSSGGRRYVQFEPVNKQQATQCHEGNSWDIKKVCWDAYKKARGTRFTEIGSRRMPRYQTPFRPTDFVIQRMCSDTCEGEDCNEVVMPGALEDMDDEDKAAVGQGIKDLMDGDTEKVPNGLKELIEILPAEDLDAAEFAAIDTDGNGQLSVPELADFYSGFTPEQIQEFVDEVDANGNGDIDIEEFKDFKDAMRNFQPNVDLISGDPATFTVMDDEEVHEVKAKWTAIDVQCMKDGKLVPESECEGTKEDALDYFDWNCAGPSSSHETDGHYSIKDGY